MRRKSIGEDADFRWAARIVLHLASGLAHAHAAGIIHRDVKPANVLIDADGTPLLTDFGLAADRENVELLTHSKQVVGTPLYSAPEQALRHTGAVSPASDQYSLGVIFFELLTGRTPFHGPPEYILLQHLESEAPSPRQFSPRVPRDLETICRKCLEKRPENRYANCQELADDLSRWLAGNAIKARPIGRIESAARWVRRRPVAASLILVLDCLLLVLAALGWQYVDELSRLNVDLGQALDREKKVHEKAQRQESIELRTEYANALSSANLAIKSERHQEADNLLEAARAKIAPTLPGFEWRLLKQMGLYPGRSPFRHESRPCAAVYSRDGKLLATGSEAPAAGIIIWDTTSGTSRHIPTNRAESIWGLQFSADGSQLASIDRSAMVRLWDSKTGSAIRSRKMDGQYGYRVFFSPPKGNHDRLIVTHGKFLEVVALPDIDKTLLKKQFDHNIDGSALTSDGWVVGMSEFEDTSALLVDARTGSILRRLPTESHHMEQFAFSSDDRILAVARQNAIDIWDAGSEEKSTIQVDEPIRDLSPVRFLAFTPDNARLITMGRDRHHCFALYDVAKRTLIGERVDARIQPLHVKQFGISPDGKTVAVPGSRDNSILLMDAHWPPRAEQVIPSHSKICFNVAFTPDSRQIVTCGNDGVAIWDVNTHQRLRSIGTKEVGVFEIALSPDGKRLATTDAAHKIHLWDFESGRHSRTSPGHTDRPIRIAFSRDGKRLFSASWDGTCRVLEPHTGNDAILFDAHGKIRELALHPFADLMMTATETGAIQVWDATNGHCVGSYPNDRWYGGFGMLYNRDGKFAYWTNANVDAVFRLDLDAGGHPELIFEQGSNVLALTPDGASLVDQSKNGELRFRDLVSQVTTCLLQLPTSDWQYIRALRFSPNGQILAAACADGSLRLWQR